MTKFLTFQEHPKEQIEKTIVVDVINTSTTYVVGHIKWRSAWRKYCLFPTNNTVFDVHCLKEIIDKIDTLMQARKR